MAQFLACKRELSKSISGGWVLGPFQKPPALNFRSSPVRVVPRDDGDFRMIHDLSFPRDRSVNDQIDMENFDCKVDLVEDVIRLIWRTGR